MSLRTRLTLSYTAFFAAALLLLGFGTFLAVRQFLIQSVENDLEAGSQQLRAIYNAGGLSRLVRPNGELVVFVRGDFAQVFDNPNVAGQVFLPTGELAGRSPNMEGIELPLPSAALDLAADDEDLYVIREINGTRVISLITPLAFEGSNQVVAILQLSRTLRDVEMMLGLLLYILLGGGLIALFITTAGVTWLSRAALAPIDQVTQTAQSIVRAEDLGQRVPVPASHDELHRLTITINELLGRMEMLFMAQRRFVADVSHELRTPLAAMQGNLEVLARGAHRDPELLNESLVDMRRETTRLIRMVNDLLLLAQSEAGVPLRREVVELDTLLLEVHRELRALAGAVNLRIGAEDQVQVLGDRDRLKQALLNLGVNALQHTPAGGTVTLSLERRDGFACLIVADTGVGIAAEDIPHLFDRFYRADRARTRHGGGAGLGLSIVKRIAEGHGGYATVASVLGQGSTFALWLPLAASAPALLEAPAVTAAPAALVRPES